MELLARIVNRQTSKRSRTQVRVQFLFHFGSAASVARRRLRLGRHEVASVVLESGRKAGCVHAPNPQAGVGSPLPGRVAAVQLHLLQRLLQLRDWLLLFLLVNKWSGCSSISGGIRVVPAAEVTLDASENALGRKRGDTWNCRDLSSRYGYGAFRCFRKKPFGILRYFQTR